MESYVTSYSGAEDATKTAITQEKLNSCIKSLHDLVDTFEPLKTEQEYAEMRIEDQDYYTGFTKQFEPPAQETTIITPVCNLNLAIGKLDSQGIFTATRPIEMSSTSSQFRIIGVTQSYYVGPEFRGGPDIPPPDADDYKPHPSDLIIGTQTIDDTVTGSNGEVISREGTVQIHNSLTYADLRCVRTTVSVGYADWRWEGLQQNAQYSVGDITTNVDLSHYRLNIIRRYKKDVSRVTTG